MTTCLGRSSWTTRGGVSPNYEQLPLPVGAAYVQGKNRTLDYEATWQGVRAIQAALIRRGYEPGPVDGWFGFLTAAATIAFKRANGRPASSKIGNITAKILFGPDVAAAAETAGLPEELLCGIVAAEASFDPGAVGCQTPNDLGLCQLNTDPKVHPELSHDMAFDVPFALRWTADRLIEAGLAYDRLKAPRIDREPYVIAQHNWPVGARDWARTGVAPVNNISGESLAAYVGRVMAACA